MLFNFIESVISNWIKVNKGQEPKITSDLCKITYSQKLKICAIILSHLGKKLAVS